MKKNILTILLAISIFSLLALYSCSERSNDMPVGNSGDFEYSDMVFPSFDDILDEEVIGGTIDKDFSTTLLAENQAPSKKGASVQCGDQHHHRRGCAYGKILRKLHLTKNQKTQIYQFKKDFHKCVKDARRYYQTEKGKVLKASCRKRKAIIKKWRNGDITKTEACRLLKQLRTLTKNQIADLKAEFRAAVADCLCTFLQDIVSVLDDTQKETFINWVDNNNCIQIDCDLDGGGPPPPPPDLN